MFKYLKNKAVKYKLSKEINKFESIFVPKEHIVFKLVELVEFEVPENAQYNPRIPDLIQGKVKS